MNKNCVQLLLESLRKPNFWESIRGTLKGKAAHKKHASKARHNFYRFPFNDFLKVVAVNFR